MVRAQKTPRNLGGLNPAGPGEHPARETDRDNTQSCHHGNGTNFLQDAIAFSAHKSACCVWFYLLKVTLLGESSVACVRNLGFSYSYNSVKAPALPVAGRLMLVGWSGR